MIRFLHVILLGLKGGKSKLQAGDMISGKGYFKTKDGKVIEFHMYVFISKSQTGKIHFSNFLSTLHGLNEDIIKSVSTQNYMLKTGYFI
jgi:hypothetical protein